MRALLVDDEPLALQSMERMLERIGVTVVASFNDPRQALEQGPGYAADVAFLDIEMPVMNGLETAVRLQEAYPSLEIVFVTAYDHYAVKAFELEAVDYVLKPVQPKRLAMTIERLRRNAPVAAPEPQEESGALLCCFRYLSVVGSDGSRLDIHWRTMKSKELFAYLAHMRGSEVTKDTLLELLWPEADLSKAMANLHTTVYQLRRALKAAGVAAPIDYNDGTYRLAAEAVQLDVDRWERELDHIRDRGAESLKDRLRLLLQEYRGDYFAQEGYLWAENERERLRIKWLEHAREAAAYLENEGDPSDAIRLYQRMQDMFPLLEDSYLGLMRFYVRLGRTNEVHFQYEKLQRTLKEEVGARPGPDVASWYESWLARRNE